MKALRERGATAAAPALHGLGQKHAERDESIGKRQADQQQDGKKEKAGGLIEAEFETVHGNPMEWSRVAVAGIRAPLNAGAEQDKAEHDGESDPRPPVVPWLAGRLHLFEHLSLNGLRGGEIGRAHV